jgi:flagellin
MDGVSMVQTADGAAGEIGKSLITMKQLAVQASNGTYSPEQKNIMQRQFADIAASISQTTGSTSFNGVNLFKNGQKIDIAVGDGDAISFDTKNISVGAANISVDPAAAMAVVDQAIIAVSEYRGDLGATVNRLQSTANVINTKAENIVAAESRISDADFAKEAAAMTAQKISVNTGVAAQSQANTIAQAVAMLLG